MSIKSIVHNRIAEPFKTLRNDIKNHRISIGFSRFISSVAHGTTVGAKSLEKLQNKIYKKLYVDFKDILDKYQEYQADCSYDKSIPVWVFWMQGYDNAPEIVKKCIDSIKLSTNHPVYILTSDNISDYYSFPDYIKHKYQDGIITHAQFSDILRMTLLAEFGGLWVDATIFIPNRIPEKVFQRIFFTCKRDIKDSGYVSNYRWTSFLNGCQLGCVIQKAAKELFFAYWEKYDNLIDYLLVDYFFLLIYDSIPQARELIDNLPYNNLQIEELQNHMNLIYDEAAYRDLIYHSGTDFFKLSWRMNFKVESNGKQTYYNHNYKLMSQECNQYNLLLFHLDILFLIHLNEYFYNHKKYLNIKEILFDY